MRAQTVPAALIVATLLVGTQSPAAAGAAQCGGFVRHVASGDVEVSVRGQRVEVRLRDARGAARDAEGVAAVAVEGEAEQIALHRVSPGFLVGDASGPISAQIIRLRLVFDDGAVGAARFPVRRATCAAASNQSP